MVKNIFFNFPNSVCKKISIKLNFEMSKKFCCCLQGKWFLHSYFYYIIHFNIVLILYYFIAISK